MFYPPGSHKILHNGELLWFKTRRANSIHALSLSKNSSFFEDNGMVVNGTLDPQLAVTKMWVMKVNGELKGYRLFSECGRPMLAEQFPVPQSIYSVCDGCLYSRNSWSYRQLLQGLSSQHLGAVAVPAPALAPGHFYSNLGIMVKDLTNEVEDAPTI